MHSSQHCSDMSWLSYVYCNVKIQSHHRSSYILTLSFVINYFRLNVQSYFSVNINKRDWFLMCTDTYTAPFLSPFIADKISWCCPDARSLSMEAAIFRSCDLNTYSYSMCLIISRAAVWQLLLIQLLWND